MMVEFDEWGEKDWYTHPTGTKTEDIPRYKKKYGGLGFTEAGRIYISKGARWRRAIFWHEKGHCLLFEAGRVLVPWNTGGMTQATVLGVPTLTYLPYCFFNIISPLMTILVAALGWKIWKKDDGSKEALFSQANDCAGDNSL